MRNGKNWLSQLNDVRSVAVAATLVARVDGVACDDDIVLVLLVAVSCCAARLPNNREAQYGNHDNILRRASRHGCIIRHGSIMRRRACISVTVE